MFDSHPVNSSLSADASRRASGLPGLAPGHRRAIALSLMLLMVLTRGHHFTPLHHLPEASWAVFFLAGVYLLPAYFAVFCALAAGIDYAAVTWGGVSSFCVSRAYFLLLPAYGSLWLAGRWYAVRHHMAFASLIPLAMALVAGVAAAELFSSGGFYWFSGRFEPTLGEFLARETQYFPASLAGAVLYLGIALLLHVGLTPGLKTTTPYAATGKSARQE